MPTPKLICDRCGRPCTSGALRIQGEPPAGSTGVRLARTTLCVPDCAVALQRFLACPEPIPADFEPPADWPRHLGRSAEPLDLLT